MSDKKPPAPPPNPNPKADEEKKGLPAAAQKWLGEKRTVASSRTEGNQITIVSWPDFQKESFKLDAK